MEAGGARAGGRAGGGKAAPGAAGDVEQGLGAGAGGLDPELGELFGGGPAGAFREAEVRRGFVRKVFGIVAFQLLVSSAVAVGMSAIPPLKAYVASPRGAWTLWTGLGVTLALVLTLSCSPDLARRHPHGLILLSAFTAAEGWVIGAVTMFADTQIVISAALITVVVVAALTLFAFQTKYDFTMKRGLIFTVLLGLVLFGLGAMFFRSKVVTIAWSAAGAAVFSAILVVDVQLLMSGKRYSLSEDDYILAALAIYLDVVNIFMHILRLLQASQR